MPRVSVVTRTKNRPIMLPRARESIEQQTFRDFVWVVVNDAGEREYVDQNAEQARNAKVNVLVVHREQSTGMEAASNAGVRATDSELVVIHDDDDSWEPNFLEHCVAFLDEHPEYIGVTSLSYAIYEKLERDKIVKIKKTPYNPYLECVHIADMVQQNLYAPISFIFRRSIYDEVGGFDESLPVLGDWDFNLRVLLKGDIGLLPRMLANYHIRESVPEDQVVYGNSITAGMNIHQVQDTRYRNLKVRQDLENGVFGLGMLLCQGRQVHRMTKSLEQAGRVLSIPSRAWRRIKRTFRS